MEYATSCLTKSENQVDNGFQKYVGWQTTIANNPTYQILFSPERMRMYQEKITDLLQGTTDRPIVVPLNTIGNILSQCYETHTPTTGDIYSRYIIPTDVEDDASKIVNRMINIIVSQIRLEFEMTANNKKLTVWNSLYGDFNKEGLRSHPPLKMRNRGPQRNQYHMNY
jgi:hypothetical protein